MIPLYGSVLLKPHHVLCYGWTKEFFEAFSSLKYSGIELPLTLLRHYHKYIAPLVDRNLSNQPLISQLQKKHGLYSFRDVQKALERRPTVRLDLSRDSKRNMLAVHTRQAQFLPFVLDRFPNADVLVILWSSREEVFLPDRELPRSYRVFKVLDEVSKAHPDPRAILTVMTKADLLLQKHTKHMVFGQPVFKVWLRKLLLVSIKMVHVMTRMFLENPIKVILSNGEIANPGLTLSLLAAQYNLPFVNALTSLITDRNLIPTRAAYYCVWGEYYRAWLEKRGIEASKIILTGNLRFEYDRHPSSFSRQSIQSLLNYPENNLVFMYTTQPFSDKVKRAVTQWINQAVTDHPVTVLIKPHPYDKFDYGPFTKTGRIVIVPESLKLYDLLPNIDFIMTISSDTAIEAALLQKGIIVLQPELPYHFDLNNNDFHSFLTRCQAGFVASSPKSLRNILADLCRSEEMRNNLHAMGQKFLNNTIRNGTLSTPSKDMYQFIKTILN